jgi:hypothetical protein
MSIIVYGTPFIVDGDSTCRWWPLKIVCVQSPILSSSASIEMDGWIRSTGGTANTSTYRRHYWLGRLLLVLPPAVNAGKTFSCSPVASSFVEIHQLIRIRPARRGTTTGRWARRAPCQPCHADLGLFKSKLAMVSTSTDV